MKIVITNTGIETVGISMDREIKSRSLFEFEIVNSGLKLTGTYSRKYSDTIIFSEVEKEIIEQIRNI